ncbi:PREDICTED: bromodomain-containing protein DDB_G0280777-like [Acropora digitifera]|uniref:bromodomain-containing protein DDB_G0280777-like n=1 Tax=Acropora digitifera TaxID=70779 RepID=UPI00077B2739|nr:PREDICTED: bromodomain-containing protein DDB_G0280777-like [Acropora digitifera]
MFPYAILLTICCLPLSLGSTNVYNLNEHDFDGYIRDKDMMLVEFFTPWCHHCQQLNPELDAAADVLATKHQYVFAKVNCDNDGKDVCRRFNIQGYPTMKLFKYGQYVGDYVGQRDRGSLMQYVDSVASTISPNTPLTNGAATPVTFAQPNYYKPNPPMLASHQVSSLHSSAQAKKPSLLASFYGSSAHAQGPQNAAAFLGNAPPILQASPDSLESKFGSMASLDIYRAKLKMIAAYKNYQRRLKDYRRKLLSINKARVNPGPQHMAGAITQPPRPGVNAFAQPQTFRGYYRPEAQAAQSVQINRIYPQAAYGQYAYGYHQFPVSSPYYRSKTGLGGKRNHGKHRKPAHRLTKVRNPAFNKQHGIAQASYKAAQYYKQLQEQNYRQQPQQQQKQQGFQQQRQQQQQQQHRYQQQQRFQQQPQQQTYRQPQHQYEQQFQQQQLKSLPQPQRQSQRQPEQQLQFNQQTQQQQQHQQQHQQLSQEPVAKPKQQVYVAPKISRPKTKLTAPPSPKSNDLLASTDTAALKDLKDDIESAIQDALKNAVKDSDKPKPKPTPTVAPSAEVAGERAKTQDLSGSGSGAQAQSPTTRGSGNVVHGEASGSGAKADSS